MAAEGTLSVSPPFQDINVESNSAQAETAITYYNNSTELVELELYALDFRQVGPTGKIEYLIDPEGTYSYSLASFVSLEADRIVLEPHGSQQIRVRIINRPDLSPGGHYAAVIARLVDNSAAVTDDQKLIPALSSYLLARKVGGERFNLSLLDLSWPRGVFSLGIPQNITTTFDNQGNVHLIPRGLVEIKDVFGRIVYRGTINESSQYIFPETRREIELKFQQLRSGLPLMLYFIEAHGNDSLDQTTFIHRETFLYVSPWILVLISVIIVAFISYKFYRRRKYVS